MPTQGLGSVATQTASPAASSTPATRQQSSKKGNPATTAWAKEPTPRTPRITRATSRTVPPIPAEARVLRPATSSTASAHGKPSPGSATPSPHRPALQVTLRDLSGNVTSYGPNNAKSYGLGRKIQCKISAILQKNWNHCL
ncbi:hypothetical protein B0H16DRAFT_1448404 [Mycena metata]|uniref:Uncharacterized protein n=1 Tax=Mycena metata TaxID=1033252 RepID=A0AAD7K9H0_9AGAR|nr:hypothetical protein B0H16DRAFT_1448404 [Mycena metata]